MNFDWTEPRVALLRRRRDEGATAATIAAELGCSRNAVLGMAHRLRRALIGKPVRPDVQLLDEIVAAEPERGVPLWNLRLRHCRWLDASGAPWLFCGAPKTQGSYCEEHAKRVFYKPNREENP